MNFTMLKQVRQQLYASFERRADALFDLTDALLCESQAKSLAELSLSPHFRRTWTNVYKALQEGKLQIEQIRATLVEALLAAKPENEPIWIAVDGSNFSRPDAKTSADRTIIHLSNLPLVKKPIGVGWTFSSIVLIPEQTSSWTPILDHQRITSTQTAIAVAIDQLTALKPLFGTRQIILLADRWYATPAFLRACHDLGYSVLLRLKSNRKLFRAPVRRYKNGRSPLDGTLFQGKRPETHEVADEVWSAKDQTDRTTRISRWNHLHFKEDRDLHVQVIRVEREAAKGTRRDPRVSWFVMLDHVVPLSHIAQHYCRRFSQEHGYRFLKQDLLWARVHVRTPEQMLLWSWVVALAFNQLYLARELGQEMRQPWERNSRPVTPRQVRRMMPAILLQVGTPTRSCQPRGKAPGRTKGFHPKRATRYLYIRKTSKKDTKDKTAASP